MKFNALNLIETFLKDNGYRESLKPINFKRPLIAKQFDTVNNKFICFAGGFIHLNNSTKIEVWLSGFQNPNNWLEDRQVLELDLVDPNIDLSKILEIINKIIDIAYLVNRKDLLKAKLLVDGLLDQIK